MRNLIFFTLFYLAIHPAFADSVVGQWITIDDNDSSKRFEVNISKTQDGELEAVIANVLQTKDADKKCTSCPGAFQNKPLVGLKFLWGFKQEDSRSWKKGRILDPETGNIYKAQLRLSEDKSSLDVRGYIGVPWIGRSQTWVKPE